MNDHTKAILVSLARWAIPYMEGLSDDEVAVEFSHAYGEAAELLPILIKSAPVPAILCEYDPEWDEHRGTANEIGFYRDRAVAEALASNLNAELLAKQNSDAKRVHEIRERAAQQGVLEHNALVAANLREGPTKFFTPKPFIPKTELRIFTYPKVNPTERNARWGTERHYFVKDMEFDDD